ncbi:MAG: hypothetical protein QXQ43_05935 [Nitrososphaerota archaeon]
MQGIEYNIRKILNEPEKKWHYIHAASMTELFGKLREVIKIILKEYLLVYPPKCF